MQTLYASMPGALLAAACMFEAVLALGTTVSLQAPTIGAVDDWLNERVIRHGLCPWASRSLAGGDLRIVVSDATDEAGVLRDLHREAEALLDPGTPLAPLATTLLVCCLVPSFAVRTAIQFSTFACLRRAFSSRQACHLLISSWRSSSQEQFELFDEFVLSAQATQQAAGVSLVAFHPLFERWREPPRPLKRGSSVRAYFWEAWADEDAVSEAIASAEASGEDVDVKCVFRKSAAPVRAIVITADEDEVGVRNVCVRYADPDVNDGGDSDVPIDWVLQNGRHGPPMADNWIHRAPVPVIHLLRGDELERESLRAGDNAIMRLQSRNARLMRLASRLYGEEAGGGVARPPSAGMRGVRTVAGSAGSGDAEPESASAAKRQAKDAPPKRKPKRKRKRG